MTTDRVISQDFNSQPRMRAALQSTSSLDSVSSSPDSQAANVTSPSFSRPLSITERPMMPGTWGTFESLEEMARAVRGELEPDFSGYLNPEIIAFAQSLACNASTPREAAQAIFDYAAHSIEYVPHPPDKQVVQDAYATIQLGYADCVSKSILIATLEAALGFDVRFEAEYWNDSELFTHVAAEVWLDGEWLAQDAVAANKPMGYLQRLPDDGFRYTQWIF